ncbi:MAG: hypothetical protein F4Y01_11270 [Gammaproteobacteria bacterium]|nr:hypothetical protein [Gammaproteobacteria bacterium]
MKLVRQYLQFVARTPVLIVAMVVTVALAATFPALPLGGEMLDVRQGYDHGEVMAAMEQYGEAGRRVYVWASATLDMLFPIAAFSLLAGLITRLRPNERLGTLAFVPIAGAVFDFGENIQIMAMLGGYPDISTTQVTAASTFTQLKWLAINASFLLVIGFGLTALLRRMLRARRER